MRLAIMTVPHGNPRLLNAILSDAAQRGADRLLLLGDGGDEAAGEAVHAITDQIGRSLQADLELLTVGSLPPGVGTLGRRPPAWACGALAPGDFTAIRDVPKELATAGVLIFEFPGASHGSRSDEDYRAAAIAVLASRPAARVCIGMFEPAPAAIVVARDGTVIRADHAITARIDIEQLTFVSPGGLGRRREDAGPGGWAAVDSEANTIELHSAHYDALAPHGSEGGAAALDPHTSRVAGKLRAWLSGAPQHAA